MESLKEQNNSNKKKTLKKKDECIAIFKCIWGCYKAGLLDTNKNTNSVKWVCLHYTITVSHAHWIFKVITWF